jgi:Ca2+/H+ antiporter, TMEM165/GDT1 family
VDFERLGLLTVFVSAATPWLEVVVVVPAAIAAGLAPVPVAVVAFAGNLLTLVLVVLVGDRMAAWWRRRRHRDGPPGPAPAARNRRAEQVFDRWGLPGLALVGPLVTGTHLAGLIAVGFGAARHRVMAWMIAGLALWTVIVAVLAVALGLERLF